MLDVMLEGDSGAFHIDLAFQSTSDVTALFGPSGSGKSTIVNMIAGLRRPRNGRIVVRDEVLFDSEKGIDVPARKRRVGYVFQDSRLFPHLSVRRNLTYARLAGRRAARGLFEEVVELLELGPHLDRHPQTLSGGEKQRVAIGRALLSDPKLLLMDEPLASLDQALKGEILPYLDRLHRETHLPIIYVSHSLGEVSRFAETMVIISDGKLKAMGPVTDVMTRLDLGPATGRHEASSLISGRVVDYDAPYDLTRIRVGSQHLEIPGTVGTRDVPIRLRLRARDISIARNLGPDTRLSIRNRLQGRVEAISQEQGAYAEVVVNVDGQKLRVRLTRRSIDDLEITEGVEVSVLIKAIAIDRRMLQTA
ncbi:molybdenum ABC transporter ATP-binding protein [Coralliovum pocilloporae]|uniref:molybdenum ABC transporter ATP-binding protein n=1 Tax=Coralliovum pocilloporae TaxID=3066369 RepID=UPI003307C2A3